MIKVEGKYTAAKVFTNSPQETALEQIKEMLDQPFMEGLQVRIMPDYHAGKGCVIGTTIKIEDKVVPNIVGVDLGCGVGLWELGVTEVNFEKLDNVIRKFVPSGSAVHEEVTSKRSIEGLMAKDFKAKVLWDENTNKSLGSLGGGNHFIELSTCDEGKYYLTIHTGSRYVGARIANYYQKQAVKQLKKDGVGDLIEELKAQGRFNEIQEAIQEYKKENPTIPKDLAYVEGKLFEDYLHDVERAQDFARRNRAYIAKEIIENMGWEYKILKGFDTVHNYIDTDRKILRKGAVSAQAGEMLVIPINMRDGTIVAVGKGNPEWNYSAPHGAGRVLSRTKAKEQLSMEEFKEGMQGVWSTSVTEDTLDEAPGAYKTMDEIIEQIGDTVDIVKVIRPVYNFKAIDEYKPKYKK